MKTIRRLKASLPVLIGLAIAVPGAADDGKDDAVGEVRGITLSTHRGGREFGDPDVMTPSFEAIRVTGANWVAVHPYARIRKDGTVSFRRWGKGDGVPPQWTVPIEVARRTGMRICVKPHLAHWRSGFSWRGEIAFETDEAWARFWRDYADWITALAEACSDADMFVVGTELDLTVGHEAEWRRLIAKVRAKTDAPLTFASNWDAFEKVPFWDALDLVGIQAYFPISEAEDPDREQLSAGWAKLSKRLSRFSGQVGRPIVLTELGYNRSRRAASQPWAYAVDPDAEPLQARCMSVALSAIAKEPTIVGSFLWKWFPEPRPVGRNFQLATDGMRRAIRSVWIGRDSEE